jgi:DNA-directed RNA polymerase specialized sigma24 family protein
VWEPWLLPEKPKQKSLSLMTKSHGAVRIVVKGSVSRMEPETSESYDEIDWAVVYERLRVVALHCADRMPDIFDGVSAEDVVTQVLSAYFESSNGLGWNPAIGPLDRFLLRVLRNRTIDRIRRQSRVAGSFDDPEFTKGVYRAQPKESESDEPNDLSRQLHEAANGDHKLEELVTAAGDIDDGYNINQQLAKELRTTTEDIVNRKRRLTRRFWRK